MLVLICILGAAICILGTASAGPILAQDQQSDRIDSIETQVESLEGQIRRMASRVDERASQGGLLFLVGVFCALWAQNSGRNAWLWFFLGLFFNFFTLLVLLSKNAGDMTEDLEFERDLSRQSR